MEILREQAPSETVFSLCGNKMDKNKEREISYQEGQNFARKHKISVVYEVSAATGENADLLFDQIAMQCDDNSQFFVSTIHLVPIFHLVSNLCFTLEYSQEECVKAPLSCNHSLQSRLLRKRRRDAAEIGRDSSLDI